MRLALAPLAPVLALLLALSGAGCGGSQAKLETARHLLERGELERVLAVLEDARGVEADALRAKVARLQDHRRSVADDLARFRATRGDRTLAELTLELRGMLAREVDPRTREWIRQELSETADWTAERNAARPIARLVEAPRPGRPTGVQSAGLEPRERREEDHGTWEEPEASATPLLDFVLAEARDARDLACWSRARTLLADVLEDAPVHAERVAPLLAEIEGAAAREAEELLRETALVEEVEGLEAAWRTLGPERWRFPSTGECARLHRVADDLGWRLRSERERSTRSPRETSGPDPEPTGVPGPADPFALSNLALLAEARDDLVEARALWERAAVEGPLEAERERARRRARDLSERLAFRGAFDARAGAPLDWTRVAPADWPGILAAARDLPPSSRAGVLLEFQASAAGQRGPGDPLVRQALDEVALHLEEGVLDDEGAHAIVAALRGEAVPAQGYLRRAGRWTTPDEVDAATARRRADRLVDQLARLPVVERGPPAAELGELVRRWPLAREKAGALLRARWAAALEELRRGDTIAELEALAELRSELDLARDYALELVFDGETYFYPYNPPSQPGKTAADYVRAQARVDEALAEVRRVWGSGLEVRLPERFREALREVAWVVDHRRWLAGPIELPPDWPPWFDGLDPGREVVTLRTLALSAEEAAESVEAEAIEGLNEKRWRELERSSVIPPDGSERELVRLTNAYRRMLGRRSLAWDPRLHESAAGHSEYMRSTRIFGHYEADRPGRQTPHDRMRLAGYPSGLGENCHYGSLEAAAALASWWRSSGHHRLLLDPRAREVGCARADDYWTMNLGSGVSHLEELDRWRD